MLSLLVQVIAEKGFIQRVELLPSQKGKLEVAIIGGNQELARQVNTWIEAYLAGKPLPQLPLAWAEMSPYTETVLNTLTSIPFGSTISYKELATKTGKPRGARAAGSACGRNPFPFFIPCHRVVASNGGLGGFTGGLDIKKKLLEFEARKDRQ